MIPWFKPFYWGNEKKYVVDALDSTWISDGKYISQFESAFGAYNEVKNTITVCNGTAALELALLSLGIGKDDEVIVPGFTFSAPANMVLAIGAKVVFADIDPDTWCMSPSDFESKITPRTRAVIPVHIYGNVCDMVSIAAVAKKSGIYVIEDVAEAAFSKLNGQFAGTFGDFGCFSFQATKTLTMGEGGAVITQNNQMADRARLIRNHGMRPENRYWHECAGHNFRLTNYQAALGYGQMEKVDEIIKEKKRVYSQYAMRLSGAQGLKLQMIQSGVDAVMWAIAIKLIPQTSALTRDEVRIALQERGIETRAGFYSFSMMPFYQAPSLPISEEVSRNVISLPSYAQLSNEEIDTICANVLSVINDKKGP